MKLYHLTSEMDEARILDRGFAEADYIECARHDSADDTVTVLGGVMFDESKACKVWERLDDGVFLDALNMRGRGRAIVVIDVPDNINREFEISDARRPDWNHWVIPIQIANRYIAR